MSFKGFYRILRDLKLIFGDFGWISMDFEGILLIFDGF